MFLCCEKSKLFYFLNIADRFGVVMSTNKFWCSRNETENQEENREKSIEQKKKSKKFRSWVYCSINCINFHQVWKFWSKFFSWFWVCLWNVKICLLTSLIRITATYFTFVKCDRYVDIHDIWKCVRTGYIITMIVLYKW